MNCVILNNEIFVIKKSNEKWSKKSQQPDIICNYWNLTRNTHFLILKINRAKSNVMKINEYNITQYYNRIIKKTNNFLMNQASVPYGKSNFEEN